MRILFLSKFFYPYIGGVEKHVLRVGEELVKQGHQVTVLTQKHKTGLNNQDNYHGLTIVRLPYSASKWGIWQNLWTYRPLFQQANIIHCHDIFFWYLPFRFLYPSKPVFTTFHGWEGTWPIPAKNIRLRKIWEKLSFGNICVGNYLTKYYFTKPDAITYGAVDVPSPLPTESSSKKIVFIGRLSSDLGLKQLLPVFKNLKVTFIGDGLLKPQCQKIGKVLGQLKDLRPILKTRPVVFASSYLTIWEALAYRCQVFSLYQNPLKKDYLINFPAAKNIHVTGEATVLVKQLVWPLPPCRHFPSWQEVAKIYLNLWQKKTARSI